jgi:hypothetical protein
MLSIVLTKYLDVSQFVNTFVLLISFGYITHGSMPLSGHRTVVDATPVDWVGVSTRKIQREDLEFQFLGQRMP